MSWNVLVTLVDDATDAIFAESEMPPADLPESFESETTLQIGDVPWLVVHAEPITRDQYTKTGALTLRLRKIETVPTDSLRCSQADITESFDDNRNLGPDEWICTTPINSMIPNPESSGLPSPNADADEVYRIACEMSEVRESLPLPDDGVYCPICHIANVDLVKLRTPCPKCGRNLLQFGWD